MPIQKEMDFVNSLELTDREKMIGEQILKEIKARLKFLLDVGLDYLSLSRSAGTLSGGEAQRIRLATQIGSGLMGVLYILTSLVSDFISVTMTDLSKHLNIFVIWVIP